MCVCICVCVCYVFCLSIVRAFGSVFVWVLVFLHVCGWLVCISLIFVCELVGIFVPVLCVCVLMISSVSAFLSVCVCVQPPWCDRCVGTRVEGDAAVRLLALKIGNWMGGAMAMPLPQRFANKRIYALKRRALRDKGKHTPLSCLLHAVSDGMRFVIAIDLNLNALVDFFPRRNSNEGLTVES